MFLHLLLKWLWKARVIILSFPSRHKLGSASSRLSVPSIWFQLLSVLSPFFKQSEFFQGIVIFSWPVSFPRHWSCDLIYLVADSELCSLKNQSKTVIVFFHGLYLNACYPVLFLQRMGLFFNNNIIKI